MRVVTSDRAGMGKSLYIKRLTETFMKKRRQGPHRVVVPIHGPTVTADIVVKALSEHMCYNTQATIFHLDISPSVSKNSCKSSPIYSNCCLMVLHYDHILDVIVLRFWGRWTPFSSACWCSMDCVIARGECGDVIPHIYMPLRLPSQR